MATGFLILHGVENHRPPEHWQFLLTAQLVEHGLEVRHPALPGRTRRSWNDGSQPWSRSAPRSVASRVVVCNSLACLLWFHAAGRGADGAVERLLLVSPPASERVPDSAASCRLDLFDAETVRASVDRAGIGHWWDVTGAKRVGLGTAWVSAKEQVLMPGSPAPDVQAPSLLDVAQGIVNKVGEREQ
jgi:predicted alpha/beta hydrolase family esterase